MNLHLQIEILQNFIFFSCSYFGNWYYFFPLTHKSELFCICGRARVLLLYFFSICQTEFFFCIFFVVFKICRIFNILLEAGDAVRHRGQAKVVRCSYPTNTFFLYFVVRSNLFFLEKFKNLKLHTFGSKQHLIGN